MTKFLMVSIIEDAVLSKSQDKLKVDEVLTLSLGFKITGEIREVFDQNNWERAYNRHDNAFRMTIEVCLKSGRKTILPLKFIRKAVMFWTRNPKIPHRIWISIIKDDQPFYPLNVDEAKALLFDVKKVIEVNGNDLKSGRHNLVANIKVRWGKHSYTEPTVISTHSNIAEVLCMK
ncbi:MAG: hypothetical protein JO327_13065 [Nitrososphaeraceae archaeon]|nr:hypothetical protein [Nitrososphaeraceae archaeon]MBV9669046.1 hypothetical protein [Nitrososphaeraceae archaeon]